MCIKLYFVEVKEIKITAGCKPGKYKNWYQQKNLDIQENQLDTGICLWLLVFWVAQINFFFLHSSDGNWTSKYSLFTNIPWLWSNAKRYWKHLCPFSLLKWTCCVLLFAYLSILPGFVFLGSQLNCDLGRGRVSIVAIPNSGLCFLVLFT